MTLLKQFQTITFHRVFVDITGGINAALMLSNAIYWTNRLPPERDGWFYKTKEEWTAETGMSRREQDNARQQLTSIGILETRRAKISETDSITALWFRVNLDRLNQYLNGGDQKHQTAFCQKAVSDPPKAPNRLSTPSYTSTTSSINNNKARVRDLSTPSNPADHPTPGACIPVDWQPSATALALLDAENIPAEFVLSCLPEFRLYWSGRGDRRPDWNPAFLKQVRNQFTRQQETAHDRSTTRQGLSGRPAPRRRETISERLERYERFIAGDDDDPGTAQYGQREPVSGEFIRH
mgnify:CR=1 FL=1